MTVQPRGGHVHIDLDTSDLRGWRVVRMVGDLDVFAAEHLTGSLDDEVTALLQERTADGERSVEGLVVDLRLVPFVDSSGLGVLLSAYQLARRAGLPVHLVSTSDELLKTITMMGLTTVLPVFSDLEAATPPAPTS